MRHGHRHGLLLGASTGSMKKKKKKDGDCEKTKNKSVLYGLSLLAYYSVFIVTWTSRALK